MRNCQNISEVDVATDQGATKLVDVLKNQSYSTLLLVSHDTCYYYPNLTQIIVNTNPILSNHPLSHYSTKPSDNVVLCCGW